VVFTVLDETDEITPEAYLIARNNSDGRKVNEWGKRLLDYSGENGLLICNGKFGKDKEKVSALAIRCYGLA
jgi:hypothetical protein